MTRYVTTPRSIAEIIGWEHVWVTAGEALYPIHEAPKEGGRRNPTESDMLAWLHDPTNERHGYSVIAIEPTPAGWSVRYHPWVGEYYDEQIAPTLHEALTAAVLAVAEREEAGDE